MPRAKAKAAPAASVESVQKQTNPTLPRFQMSEMGQTGLRVFNGIPYEELKRDLQYPQSMQTFKKMSYDSTIAAALTLYDLFLMKANWKIKLPKEPTEEQKLRAKFIEQCMHDMDHTWLDFTVEAGTMMTYGFSVHEKVYRKRNRSAGSKYNDGLIGWKKLPIRSQDTIDEWIYSDDGRQILAVKQDLSNSGSNVNLLRNGKDIIIPRNKFLHFVVGKNRENPLGQSPLRNVYYAWKYRSMIEEQEAIGVQRDLSGYPVIYIPPQYMSDDASPEQKAIYDMYKDIIRNLHNNEQAGMVMPMAYDPDTKQPLFKFDLMGVEGGKSYDTTEIIRRYDNKILTALFADLLVMGQSSTGSFALGDLKNNLMQLAIEARFQEISNVINRDLIPQTFALNGWTDSEYPEVYVDHLQDDDIDSVSKFYQRVASVGMLTRTLDVVNKIREAIDLEPLPEGTNLDDVLPEKTSKASEGMARGASNGTSDDVQERDNSLSNLEN